LDNSLLKRGLKKYLKIREGGEKEKIQPKKEKGGVLFIKNTPGTGTKKGEGNEQKYY
jgi:hypothetical protein